MGIVSLDDRDRAEIGAIEAEIAALKRKRQTIVNRMRLRRWRKGKEQKA
ncbi:hypothetical protein [Sphingobium yanoikuyae]